MRDFLFGFLLAIGIAASVFWAVPPRAAADQLCLPLTDANRTTLAAAAKSFNARTGSQMDHTTYAVEVLRQVVVTELTRELNEKAKAINDSWEAPPPAALRKK